MGLTDASSADQLLRRLAQAGDTRAMICLAEQDADPQEALRWYLKAAQFGDHAAELHLDHEIEKAERFWQDWVQLGADRASSGASIRQPWNGQPAFHRTLAAAVAGDPFAAKALAIGFADLGRG